MAKLILKGNVKSDKMDKTVVVEVEEFVKHPIFKKYVKKMRRFKVHDEKNETNKGDTISFISCRPISKDKHFRLLKVLKRRKGIGEEK